MVIRCQVCGRPCDVDVMGPHLRTHGVNIFPQLLKMNQLAERVIAENRALTAKVEQLESRLRIVT